jgi:hypothetical protein
MPGNRCEYWPEGIMGLDLFKGDSHETRRKRSIFPIRLAFISLSSRYRPWEFCRSSAQSEKKHSECRPRGRLLICGESAVAILTSRIRGGVFRTDMRQGHRENGLIRHRSARFIESSELVWAGNRGRSRSSPALFQKFEEYRLSAAI